MTKEQIINAAHVEWKEDPTKQLTYLDLLIFTKMLSRSQGFYYRVYRSLKEFTIDEILELDLKLEEQEAKNDLMTIIDIFEG